MWRVFQHDALRQQLLPNGISQCEVFGRFGALARGNFCSYRDVVVTCGKALKKAEGLALQQPQDAAELAQKLSQRRVFAAVDVARQIK